jgi:hypothetical protein
LVVLFRDPLAPAPLAVADAAPPTPVACAVAALCSVPLELALGVVAGIVRLRLASFEAV